jgi:hypothetical protein
VRIKVKVTVTVTVIVRVKVIVRVGEFLFWKAKIPRKKKGERENAQSGSGGYWRDGGL